jgi:hypothetical protein
MKEEESIHLQKELYMKFITGLYTLPLTYFLLLLDEMDKNQ